MTRTLALCGWVILIGMLTACDTAPPAAPREPQSRPTTTTAPPPATAQTPTSSQPPETRPQEPQPPKYLTVLDKYRRGEPITLNVQDGPGRRLSIDTRNVRRLRIDRDNLPFDGRRTIILQLDGQGFEWLARSGVEVFERSDVGEWRPVQP